MIIDGKAIAARRLEVLRSKVKDLRSNPRLVILLVGEAVESQLYVRMKAKRALEVGITTEIRSLSGQSKKDEIIGLIEKLNKDKTVHGILVQLPFPKASPCEAGQREILEAINPLKDVDCLTSLNLGLLTVFRPRYYPATVAAVLIAIQESGIRNQESGTDWLLESDDKYALGGKTAVVIGRSEIVGKPMAIALANLGATVTVCNRSTENLALVTKEADILISATGVAHLIKADMVKPGVVVVDVGINAKDGKVTGDVDFENVSKVAAAISPVPGGVGPLTISSLLENTFEAAKMQSITHT